MVRLRTYLRAAERDTRLAALGKCLRVMFSEIESEPLPDRLRELVQRLERQQEIRPPTNH